MRKIVKAHLAPMLDMLAKLRCMFANSFNSIPYHLKTVQFSRDSGDEFNFLNTTLLNHDTRQLLNIYVGSFLSYLDEW